MTTDIMTTVCPDGLDWCHQHKVYGDGDGHSHFTAVHVSTNYEVCGDREVRVEAYGERMTTDQYGNQCGVVWLCVGNDVVLELQPEVARHLGELVAVVADEVSNPPVGVAA